MEYPKPKMNLGDPELELIDPTPNVYLLFVHFDKLFFWSKLNARVVVRWSKRMYSCAGICSYEGRGGVCDIALSEPLLKLRSRKDLVETLLHEMIHAYLYITCQDRDRDGHGPSFQAHMHRINQMAGINITIYHDFHDEVNLYLTHWWRCNGPCQELKPHFGVVRRSNNRAPGPYDYWWRYHQQSCGGTFTKIKEPEKGGKKKGSNPTLTTAYPDIRKYMTNKTTQTIETYGTDNILTQTVNNNTEKTIDKNIIKTNKKPKEVLKDTSNTLPNNNLVNDNLVNNAYIVKSNIIVNPPAVNQKFDQNDPRNLDYNGNISNGRQQPQVTNVAETVRNVWANKEIQTASGSKVDGFKEKNASSRKSTDKAVPNKHKNKKFFSGDSPPHKVKKIEIEEERATAVLKDIYGKDFTVSRADNKWVATSIIKVSCPICSVEVEDEKINDHLDECLNTDMLKKMSGDIESDNKYYTNTYDEPLPIPGNSFDKPEMPMVKSNIADFNGISSKPPANINAANVDDFIDLSDVSFVEKKKCNVPAPPEHFPIHTNMPSTSKGKAVGPKDVAKVKKTKKITNDKHLKNSGRVQPKKDRNVDFEYLDDEIKMPPVNIGTDDDITNIGDTKCPCCDMPIENSIDQHLDECLAFFENNATIPEEGACANFASDTIIIDDDCDELLDETQTLNATGTKNPCPCCLMMVEEVEMNNHLDLCLAS